MNYNLAVAYINSKIKIKPELGIILGSGLGDVANSIKNAVTLPYSDIPGFAVSTAPAHAGVLIVGELFGKNVVCMKGRFHYYEGYDTQTVIFPIRIMNLLGIDTLIVTNAAGGINENFKVGDIMQICDHINLTGTNPLIGKNDERFGERFFDMTRAYTPEYFSLAAEVAEKVGIELKRGVYLGCTGPSFETPAEIRAFRILGADAVGMSSVFEVIAAAHMRMKIMGFSLISNMAAGMTGEALSGDDVIETGIKSGKIMQKFIENIVEAL